MDFPPEVCKEKIALLSVWTELLSEQARLAVDLFRATKMGDAEAHRAILAQITLTHEQAVAARDAYQEHLITHRCEPAKS